MLTRAIRRNSLLTLAFSAAVLPVMAATVRPSTRAHSAYHPAQTMVEDAPQHETLHLVVGRSTILNTPRRFRRVYVGNPTVLRSYTASPHQIVITAKQAGVSSLVLWDDRGHSLLYSISADLDIAGLRRALQSGLPGENIHVSCEQERIYLSGSVTTDEAAKAAQQMAALYSKDVSNSLVVRPVHGKEVQLKVRIIEIDRTKLEQYGINLFSGGKNFGGISTQQFSSTFTLPGAGSTSKVTVSDPLNLFLYNSGLNVGMTIKDLEQRQILQILSEPTLTAMSGHTASFLSGGQFPFPVVQGGTGGFTSVTIMFQPYGVKVAFTPTVNSDGTIRLKVAPEVSTLDYANAVNISGYTIPALATRRADTEVELRSGQSFVISGLLDHRTTESLSHIPGIASIPVLGQLFRSHNNDHSVVELVFIVTPTIINPLMHPVSPVEPKMVVPNMNLRKFDQKLPSEKGQTSPN